MRAPHKDAWKQYKQAILERMGDGTVLFERLEAQQPATDGWVTARCPFHADRTPSFAFHPKTGRWCCFAGCGKGSAFDFVMQTSGRGFKETLLALGDRFGVPRPALRATAGRAAAGQAAGAANKARPPIPETLIQQWTQNLWANEAVVRALREHRGLSDVTLKQYHIGWDPKRQRYAIPIRDAQGAVVNVRLYSPHKTRKMLNYTKGQFKYGSPPRLFGLDVLVKGDAAQQVILCEGEWDRLWLQQEGFLAVTGTHGAGVFRPDWLTHFKDKDVVVLFDIDAEGQKAARTIVQAFQTADAAARAASVKHVVLPLQGTKDDKDVSDYFHHRDHSGVDLHTLIDETPVHVYEDEAKEEEILALDSFVDIEQKHVIDRKVSCDITACGETSEAFHAVEQFQIVTCPRLQKGGCFECRGVGQPATLPRGASEYIGSCMSTTGQVKAMLRDYACRHGQTPVIELLQRTPVKEFFCHQKVNRVTQTRDDAGRPVQLIDGKQQEFIEKRVYYLSSDHPKPGPYRATGWVKSHPKTQQITFLIDTLEPQADDFEGFRVDAQVEALRAFQALSWAAKLDALTARVTRIYERDEILVATLLTYCAPRWLPFNGEIIRGWLVTAVVGDAGTGKSQTTQRLAEFVDIGDTFSGLTGSRTGLSYALVEHQQKGWQVKIGRYPANSRKLLIVDEAQHLPDWDVRTLAKAMEEGFLQVDRVQSKGYESQTRLILIANPKKDRIMDTFAFGCEALKTLFPPMILRRIDLAVFANTSDLQDLSFASPPVTGDTPRQVTPEGLRAVIYWAWTLTPQQIRFAPAAERHCLQRAEALARVYGLAGDIPLVPPSDVRNKLARLAAAFAVFQVSASDDFSRLHIEPEHVDLAATFLDTIYTHENCGLDQYSALKGGATQLRDYEQIAQAFLKKRADEERVNGSATGFFPQLIYALRAADAIRRDELVEQLDCGLETVKRGVQLLKRFNLLDSAKDGYVKKPKFNRFLRRFLAAQPDFLDGLDRELPAPQAQVEAQVALSVNPGEAQVEAQVPTHAKTIS